MTFDVSSPLPGLVMKILVMKGEKIQSGQNVAIVQCMKMEVNVSAEREGKVEEILVGEGDEIDAGASIIRVADDSS